MQIKAIIAITILCLFATLYPQTSHSRIYILIDQGTEKKFPIALPQFVTPKGKRSGKSKKLVELIKKDLKIAGLFEVLDDKLLPQKDTDVKKINFKKWQALEVGALIKGVDTPKGTEIRVYDVQNQSMLFGKRYVIKGKNYVDAAHRFVDRFMKAITGKRGPFESKIAASCGKASKRRIQTFEMDSARRDGVLNVGRNNISPSWSPDGKLIAYTSFVGDFPEVYLSNGRKVTNFESTTITPAWSPDGTKLLVASAFSGDTEIYMVNMRGKVVRQLTRSVNIDFNPSVTSSGRMVFASERSGGLHLFSSSTAGGGGSRLTYTGYQNDQPDWSPDGSKIVFAGRDQGVFDIFVMDSDGSNILRLTRDEGSNESPTWSPDSRYIAFSSTRGGIYIMYEDGTNQTLVEKSGSCINLDWGPWLSKE